MGGRVRYGQEGLFVAALAGPLRIQIFPMKEKPEKTKKRKKPTKAKHIAEKKSKPEGQPGTLFRLMQLLSVAAEAAGRLKRKIRIDGLELMLIWGGMDAAAVALGYGRANAALGMIWPLLDNNFRVKRHVFQVELDYSRTEPAVELAAVVTMTVGQVVALSVHYGVKALIVWLKSGRPNRIQEA